MDGYRAVRERGTSNTDNIQTVTVIISIKYFYQLTALKKQTQFEQVRSSLVSPPDS